MATFLGENGIYLSVFITAAIANEPCRVAENFPGEASLLEIDFLTANLGAVENHFSDRPGETPEQRQSRLEELNFRGPFYDAWKLDVKKESASRKRPRSEDDDSEDSEDSGSHKRKTKHIKDLKFLLDEASRKVQSNEEDWKVQPDEEDPVLEFAENFFRTFNEYYENNKEGAGGSEVVFGYSDPEVHTSAEEEVESENVEPRDDTDQSTDAQFVEENGEHSGTERGTPETHKEEGGEDTSTVIEEGLQISENKEPNLDWHTDKVRSAPTNPYNETDHEEEDYSNIPSITNPLPDPLVNKPGPSEVKVRGKLSSSMETANARTREDITAKKSKKSKSKGRNKKGKKAGK